MADTDDREPAKDDESTETEETEKESSKKASSKTSKETSSKGKPSSAKKRPVDEDEDEDDEDEDEDDEDLDDDEDDEEPPPPPKKSPKSSKGTSKASSKTPAKTAPSRSKKTSKSSKIAFKKLPLKPASYYLPFSLLGMAIVGAHIFWDADYHPVAVLGIAITIWSYIGIGSANEVGGTLSPPQAAAFRARSRRQKTAPGSKKTRR